MQQKLPFFHVLQKECLKSEQKLFQLRVSRQRWKRWCIAYFATTIGIVLLAFVIIVVEFGGKIGPIDFEKSVERLASSLSSNAFMDLSGMKSDHISEDQNETERPSIQTDSTIDIPTGSGEKDFSSDSLEWLYTYDISKVPLGETPILPMDLSLTEYGSEYILNGTGFSPNIADLLKKELSFDSTYEWLAAEAAVPQVLILHTHGTEAYSENGAISFMDTGKEIARSENPNENVLAVGTVLTQVLKQAGIPAIQCNIMHDQTQYKASYARAEATIRSYLEKYPSIRLVIDLHRDAILKSDGSLVRPVTVVNGEKAAQVMCVVGSSWGGEECPEWENNLALALQLREALNRGFGNLCRPVSLRASTYNQELAPASLLLEVGAAGNSLEEAVVSAKIIGNTLAQILKK